MQKHKRQSVKLYDSKTRQVTEIPRAELAPGMIAVNIKNDPGLGPVFVPLDELQKGPKLRDSFPPDFLPMAREIHRVIAEVDISGFGGFIEDLKRERRPARELWIWSVIAGIYAVASAKDTSLAIRREVFRLCALMSTNGSAALDTFEFGKISRHRAKAIDRLFSLWGVRRSERFWGDRLPLNKLEPLLCAEGVSLVPDLCPPPSQGFEAVELFETPERLAIAQPGTRLPLYQAIYDADVITDTAGGLYWGRELLESIVRDKSAPVLNLLNVGVETDEDREALEAAISVVKTTEAQSQGEAKSIQP